MQVEELFEILGEWGLFQKRLFVLLALPIALQGYQTMMPVVNFAVPEHRCQIPGLDNDTFQIQNEHHRLLVESTIPVKIQNEAETYEQCVIYKSRNATRRNASAEDWVGCTSWVFDKSDFDATLISQFSLVCDKKDFRAHSNMVYMVGLLVGSTLVGYLCDRFGRKLCFFGCLLLLIVVGTISAFPPSIAVFLVYRFVTGVASIGVFLAVYVLCLEFVGPSKRTFTGSLIAVLWLVGPFLVACLSYVVRDWRHVQLISSLPLVLTVPVWWLLPESARWLLSKGRILQGVGVIRKIARVNRTDMPPVLGSLTEAGDEKHPDEGPLKLLKYPNLVVRTLIIFFNWCVVSMTYYGLSLNVDNLVGSVRVNFILSNTVELVGYVTAWLLLDRVGRKRLHCALMLLAGLALLATIPAVILGGPGLQWMTTALAMVGKLGVSGSFSIIYLMSAELYPTVIRNFGMGCSSTVARVGSAVSPYIADLAIYIEGNFGRALPMIVFGGLAVSAGMLSLILPETLHRKLPDTLQEASDFGKKEKTTEDSQDIVEVRDDLLQENQT